MMPSTDPRAKVEERRTTVHDETEKSKATTQQSRARVDQTSHKLSEGWSNRFGSFAPLRDGNDAKWFVDGCSYMWAVSEALEQATESIWILDWWLSPELYLRRPPSAHFDYRLDRMLLKAAERGVRVNIIIYKEVSSVLTLNSEHTKKALEIHPNISVFRHPDHLVSGQALESQFMSSLKKDSLKAFDLCKLSEDGLKAIYGLANDIILYWAHHEKLLLVDGKMAFMGGLDLCFGRWDTYSHPIADAHPNDLDAILFPGQDYNNARVYDFEDVSNFDLNKLDRTISSRMGWSDLSVCIQGCILEDLRAHFAQRWNFIYGDKYSVQHDKKYGPIVLPSRDIADARYKADGSLMDESKKLLKIMEPPVRSNVAVTEAVDLANSRAGMRVQLTRSCTEWSNGVSSEHSIANAYIEVIHDSEHFVYIENQFFITATGDHQHPVKNQIGAAIVERVVRAFKENRKFLIIVCMPAIPGFAGDLKADSSLGTRAIMEYQWASISRGEHSIMGAIKKAGVSDPTKYIRFYNLRNYDRLNVNTIMSGVEKRSVVRYADARREHDNIVGARSDDQGERPQATTTQSRENYDRYQDEAGKLPSQAETFDSVSGCYMDGGVSIKDVPWSGSEEDEINAFVSEELYIHTKILIADDRVVICGSANLNDRSQLGYHDSEIAVIIEDSVTVDSMMDGTPYKASQFATSLRRQLFRKHLGLLPSQDWTKPNDNFTPITKAPNSYDWKSPADLLVQDVLSQEFSNLWNGTARTNTEVFGRAFHCIPSDNVRNWEQYHSFFGSLFVSPNADGKYDKTTAKYQYGHVVREEFSSVKELKEDLDKIRGTLVEMPLNFMADVDFAWGLALNALTEEIYT